MPSSLFEIPLETEAKAAVFKGIRDYANGLRMDGKTRLYDAVNTAIQMMADEKRKQPGYLYSVVVFTDGEVTEGKSFAEFLHRYNALPADAKTIPVFVILYGEGNERELEQLAEQTRGRVFDARNVPLPAVFKEIRSYQ